MIAALLAELIIAAVNGFAVQANVLTGLLLIPVLCVALIEDAARSALVAVAAVLLAVASSAVAGFSFNATHLYRLVTIGVLSGLAVGGSELRDRAVRARRQMELISGVPDTVDPREPAEHVLQRLAAMIVPAFADMCEIEPAGETTARRAQSDVAIDLHDTALADAAIGADERRRLTGLGIRSALLSTIGTGDRPLAWMTLGMRPGRRGFTSGDVGFARTLGARVALALDNARLYAEADDARRRMEAIVGSLAEAVTIREPSGRITYANEAATRSMGFASSAELVARAPNSIMDEYVVTDEDGNPLDMDAVPSVRLLRGEPAEPLLMRTVNRKDGTEGWRLLKAAPLLDADGHIEAAVTIIEDVTEAKRAELRSRFLARVSETLAESLDFEVTLRNVAWLAVPEIADWCAVDLFDTDGERQRVVVAHHDPAKLELAQRLREYESERLDPGGALATVLRTGRARLYADIPLEQIEAAARDEEHLRMLRALGLRSGIVVPLRSGIRTLGAMTLVSAESGRRFTEDDMLFAEQIAARAAVAVENARQATQRREVARTLQRSLLPDVLPEIDGWRTAAMYRPSGSAEDVEVGGDFYDFLPTPGGWIVLLGDVTGKGIQAASMTALVRHAARFVSRRHDDPEQILAEINEALLERHDLSLCSVLCLRLDDDHVVAASAGHPAPLVVRDDGRLREIGVPGPLLGAWASGHWPGRRIALGLDETLVLYTDGVVDTQGADSRFGSRRLREVLHRHAGASPQELLDALQTRLEEFRATAASDDTAALAIRRAA